MGTRLQSLSPAASKYSRTTEFIFGSRCFFFLLFEDHLICQLTLSVNTLKTLFLLRRKVREILVFLLQKVSLKCRLINSMNGKCRNIVLKAFCYWTNIAGGSSLNLSQEQTANTVNEIFQSLLMSNCILLKYQRNKCDTTFDHFLDSAQKLGLK